MTGNEIPDLHVETDPGLGEPASRLLMTDRITVGEDAWDRDVQVFVVAGESLNVDPAETAAFSTDMSRVVIALDGDPQRDVEPWGVLDVADPDIVQRLAETLTAASIVLRQIQEGGLP
jgi:hypothetical protein